MSISSYFLLACKVFAEKLHSSFMGVPSQMMSCFFLFASKLSPSFDNLIIVCQCRPFNFFRMFWASWNWMSISFSMFKFFSIISLNKLSVLFSSASWFPQCVHGSLCWFLISPTGFLHSVMLFPFFFFNRIISSDLSLSSTILYSAWYILLLTFSIELFSVVMIFLSSKISHFFHHCLFAWFWWFLFCYCVSHFIHALFS